jgi:23S rRNA (pseudouridine1915-N3)-methyltransferase
MLNIQIICVGNIKEKFYTDAVNEYLKRLNSFAKVEITELKEYKLTKESQQEITNALKTEAKDILSHKKGYTIALCIDGKQMSSTSLATQARQFRD